MSTVKLVKFAPLTLRKELEGQDTCVLTWAIRAGYPRVTVYTKEYVAGQKPDYGGIINAPFDHITLTMLMDMFENIIDGDNDKMVQLDCFNMKWDNGVKTNDKYLQAKVVIGKDKEGVIYIAALEDKKKKVKFDLLPKLDWFKFRDKDGGELKEKDKLSKLFARAYLKTLRRVMGSEVVKDFTRTIELEPKAVMGAIAGKAEPVKKTETTTVVDATDSKLSDLI